MLELGNYKLNITPKKYIFYLKIKQGILTFIYHSYLIFSFFFSEPD